MDAAELVELFRVIGQSANWLSFDCNYSTNTITTTTTDNTSTDAHSLLVQGRTSISCLLHTLTLQKLIVSSDQRHLLIFLRLLSRHLLFMTSEHQTLNLSRRSSSHDLEISSLRGLFRWQHHPTSEIQQLYPNLSRSASMKTTAASTIRQWRRRRLLMKANMMHRQQEMKTGGSCSTQLTRRGEHWTGTIFPSLTWVIL